MAPALTAAQARGLVARARAARRRAYAPYSRFTVGAAVLTASGAVITGCNVENASYGLSMCAERVAVHRALAEGHRRFLAVAVSAGPKGRRPVGATPCGACRQVMAEFGVAAIVVDGPRATVRALALADLLPHAFHAQYLPEAPPVS
jgi:cytidine deaminase